MAAFSETEFDVAPERVAVLLGKQEIQLVDVREPYENEAGRIAGAKHIPLERVSSETNQISRDKPVVFHCRLGARSAMITEAFRSSGFDAYNLEGGIQAWADKGLPLEPENGYVADH